MKIGFTVPALFHKAETMNDRTVKMIYYSARELNGEDTSKVFSLVHSEGHLLFSPNDDISDIDVPTEKAVVAGQKTPGQRLRASLYVLWEQSGSKDDFNTVFYPNQMERFINAVKQKLN